MTLFVLEVNIQDLLMLFCRCHDSDSSVYLVVEEAL